MIGKLTGVYAGSAGEGAALVEVQGVGYAVRVSVSFIAMARQGEPVSLFIHTAVREDAIDLYGFQSEEDLSFFRQLTSVSGIGPKSALGILNVADSTSLKRGISRGDASMLTKVFGIGKKSAERIVVELRDKMGIETGATQAAEGTDAEVIEALMALGYRADESRKALKHIDGSEELAVRERISLALKYLGSGSPAKR